MPGWIPLPPENIDDLADVDLTTPPTDGQVLIYDAGSDTWIPGDQTGGGGGGGGGAGCMELIEEITRGSDGVFLFDSIPNTFDHLYIEVDGRAVGGTPSVNTQLHLQMGNGSVDTGASAYRYTSRREGTTAETINDGAHTAILSAFYFGTGPSADAGLFGKGWIRIFDYADTTHERKAEFWGSSFAASNNHGIVEGNGVWKNEADEVDVVQVSAHDATGVLDWVTGSRARLYGVTLDCPGSTAGQSSVVTRTSSFQTLTTGTETILTWQNEVRDELGIVDLGSSSTLLTIAEDGMYLADFVVSFADESSFDTGGDNFRQGRVSINGNPSSIDNLFGWTKLRATTFAVVNAVGVFLLEAGDTIQLNVTQGSGESLAVTGQRMTVVKLS